jgi:hypothetical protein
MSALKLYIEEFDDVDFQLLAFHTSLEDFRLAYFINKYTFTYLKKNNIDIKIENKFGEGTFTLFDFEDEKNDIKWSLIQNISEISSKKAKNSQNLLSEIKAQVNTKVYLLPEYKKVDYFLKINHNGQPLNLISIIEQLKQIEFINTVYSIDFENIKSKNNLIF